MTRLTSVIAAGFLYIITSGCSQGSSVENAAPADEKLAAEEAVPVDPMLNKGIGPVSSLTLGPLDEALAAEGKKIYDEKCTACHNPTQKLIGPPQAGVLERRTPEWIMNLILNPEEMLKSDPVAKQLLTEFNNVPMTNQGLTETDARKVLEYLRTLSAS